MQPEKQTARFAQMISDKNKAYVIFDIGSRDCQQSIEFYKTFPNAKIYAFECNPNMLPTCRENIKNYTDRITLVEGAVTDYDGEITFYPINTEKTITSHKDGNPGASSIFKSNGTYTIEQYVQDEVTVNCHRLDTVMQRLQIPRVDLIWMDLQGAELLALKGLGLHLATVEYIHTEVSLKEMYTNQVMFPELNDFLVKEFGFELQNRNITSWCGWQTDAIYYRPQTLFDVVIPVGPHDVEMFTKVQLPCTRKNIVGYRNIYVICPDALVDLLQSHCGNVTIVPESIFPFSIETVAQYHGKSGQNGWYLQQLLKLYAATVVPNMLERYLVIDADTCFFKPTAFYDAQTDRYMFNWGSEEHFPYFFHMSRLNPQFRKMSYKSGICHHMIFHKHFVEEMFGLVMPKHPEATNFYQVFLQCVDQKYFTGAGASEYELYFNFMLLVHPKRMILRKLKYSEQSLADKRSSHDDYASFHWYRQ